MCLKPLLAFEQLGWRLAVSKYRAEKSLLSQVSGAIPSSESLWHLTSETACSWARPESLDPDHSCQAGAKTEPGTTQATDWPAGGRSTPGYPKHSLVLATFSATSFPTCFSQSSPTSPISPKVAPRVVLSRPVACPLWSAGHKTSTQAAVVSPLPQAPSNRHSLLLLCLSSCLRPWAPPV